MTYVIAQPCVDVMDRACVIECPVDCIHEGVRTLYIDPSGCVDCHACEPVCPVEAIFHEDDLPPQWEHYRSVAVEYFEEQEDGLPPASRTALGDHPVVAALPTQSRRMRGISTFAIRKEEAADADLWFPF